MAIIKQGSFSIKRKSQTEILNSMTVSGDVPSEPSPTTTETYYNAYKTCSEFKSVVNALITDIFSGGTFKGDKELCDQMTAHWNDIKGDTKLMSWGRHAFITGDAYLEYEFLDNEKFASICASVYKDCYGKKLNKSASKPYLNYIKKRASVKNPILKYPFNIYSTKSSGWEIKTNKKGEISNYIQKINGKIINFQPENIIYLAPEDLDEVYGFTPTQACESDIATLIFAKKWATSFFENGGTPNIVYILEEARGAQDRNFEVAKSQLLSSKKQKNWNKNMVMTGKVKIERINDFNKDMEFINLINICFRNIALAFGVPPSRVPYMSESKGDIKELNAGYYQMIDTIQTQIEGMLNNRIFNNYGDCDYRFKRGYKIDEIREGQIINILYDREILNKQECRDRIGYYNKYVEDTFDRVKGGNDPKMRDPGDKQDGRGTGDDNGSRLTRSIIKSTDFQVVGFDDFIKIVRQKFVDVTLAKMLYKEYFDRYELMYKDESFYFKTVVHKYLIEDLDYFRDTYLSGAIRSE